MLTRPKVLIGLAVVAGAVVACNSNSPSQNPEAAKASPAEKPSEKAPAQKMAEAPAKAALPASGDPVRDHVANLVRDIAGDPTIKDVNAVEADFLAMHRDVLEPWRQAFAGRDAKGFARVLTAPTASPAWARAERKLTREREGIRELVWTAPAAQADLKPTVDYLSAFEAIESVSIQTRAMKKTAAGYALTLHLDLRGTVDGMRRNDRGILQVELAQADGNWKAGAIEMGNFESLEAVEGRKPTFTDVTDASGAGSVPVVSRHEYARPHSQPAFPDLPRDTSQGKSDIHRRLSE